MDRKKVLLILIGVISLAAAIYLILRTGPFPISASYFNPLSDPFKILKNAFDTELKNNDNLIGANSFKTFLSGGKSFISETSQTLKEKTTDAFKENLSGIYNDVGDALGISRFDNSCNCR